MTAHLESLIDSARAHYGNHPTHLIQAPGRVNLIGEHTDYNEGFVMPCAIGFRTVVAARRRDDGKVRVIAADYADQRDEFDLKLPIERSQEHEWANYIRGTVKSLMDRGYALNGADLLVSGNIPQGSGLSSSASLEVAIAKTMAELSQLVVSNTDIALMGQQAENDFVGCNCGIMDQMISVNAEEGHAMLLDCRSLEARQVPVPNELAVIIINSNKIRGLVNSEYNIRREQCEAAASRLGIRSLRDISVDQFESDSHRLEQAIAKRARHVITENDRTLRAADALMQSDFQLLGQLMAESHRSMRDDFEITVPEIDLLVEIIQTILAGEGGARMTGGGFGDCVVAMAPKDRVAELTRAVAGEYEKQTGLKESIFVCQPSQGAVSIAVPEAGG